MVYQLRSIGYPRYASSPRNQSIRLEVDKSLNALWLLQSLVQREDIFLACIDTRRARFANRLRNRNDATTTLAHAIPCPVGARRRHREHPVSSGGGSSGSGGGAASPIAVRFLGGCSASRYGWDRLSFGTIVSCSDARLYGCCANAAHHGMHRDSERAPRNA